MIVNESYIEKGIDIHPHQGSQPESVYSMESYFYNSNQHLFGYRTFRQINGPASKIINKLNRILLENPI